MSDGMETRRCPVCADTFELVLDEEIPGLTAQDAYNQLTDHMASAHGMSEQEINDAIVEQIIAEDPALNPEDAEELRNLYKGTAQ